MDDELEAIRQWHEQQKASNAPQFLGKAHEHRGVLLGKVDELRGILREVCSQIQWFDLDHDGRITGAGTVWIELDSDASAIVRSIVLDNKTEGPNG